MSVERLGADSPITDKDLRGGRHIVLCLESIRFYQRKGLLGTPSRGCGIRRYGNEDVRRLCFIRKAQQAGFTLEEIRELIALDAGHDRHRAHEMAEKRMAKLDEQIAELQQARQNLQRLAHECAEGKAKACPILSAFEI